MGDMPDKIFARPKPYSSRMVGFWRWDGADEDGRWYLAATPARDIADRLVEALRDLWMAAGNVEVLALADTPETIALESALAGARIVLDEIDRERKERK